MDEPEALTGQSQSEADEGQVPSEPEGPGEQGEQGEQHEEEKARPEATATGTEEGEREEGEQAEGIAVRIRSFVSSRAAAVASIGLGALALVLATTALVAALIGRGGPPGRVGTSAQIEEIKAELARLIELTRLVPGPDGEAPLEQARRIAELEARLRESEAARKVAEEALRGPLKLEPPPELVRALDGIEQVSKLKSLSSSYKTRAEQVRKQYERDLARLEEKIERDRKQRVSEIERERGRLKEREGEWRQEAVRERREFFHRYLDSARETARRTVEEAYRKAQSAEKRRDGWQEALGRYEELAALKVEGAERIAAESGKRIAAIKKRIEEAGLKEVAAKEAKARALRAKEIAAKRRAQLKAQQIERAKAAAKAKHKHGGKRPPEERVDHGDEVF